MSTILITRPQGDESTLRDALHEAGHRVIHEPLTEIFLRHTERMAMDIALHKEPDAVLLTSRHGAQALALLTELRDLFLICVGEATAEACDSLGFTRVSVAGGNVDRLIDYVRAGYDEDSRFLYVSGKHTHTDLAAELHTYGMQVEQIVAYEAHASEQLSEILVEQLKRGQVDGVTFMSPRACQIWNKLVEKAGVGDCVKNLEAFCLSVNVAEPLTGAPWKALHIADEPTLASLVDSVSNAL